MAKSSEMVRSTIICITLLGTTVAAVAYGRVIAGGAGTNGLEWASLPLFTLLFAWIVFSFCLATLGAAALASRKLLRRTSNTENLRRGSEAQPFDSALSHRQADERAEHSSPPRTAVLMPVYNESPERVFAGISAMISSLRSLGYEQDFDFYVLSDTTDHEVWLAEEHAWSQITKAHLGVRIFYRHRPKNVSRKAGNIADFCSRWGSHYPYMVVLDADSLMDGETLVELVRRMNQNPRLGILQVPPVPIGRHSLFARLQQFSAAAYGPIFVEGFSKWAGDKGNYWGHNAIIRVEPFLDHCELPVLPGKAPLGGEILSHDFVEAALMLRAGWLVELATDLGGSYEECPPTLADYAKRDQRWCQGNLQHSRLIVSENFHPLSRFHFASGVMAYCASPLWVAFILFSVLGTVLDRWVARGELSSVRPDTGVSLALILFAVSMTLLLLPKLWSVLLIAFDCDERKRFGGLVSIFSSGLVEVFFSVLLSPLMAVFHSRFVLGTLFGSNVKWSSQQRDDHGVAWSEATTSFLPFTLLGVIASLLLAWIDPGLLIWFSPLVAGLVLSIPLAVAMGSIDVGNFFQQLGSLVTPEELSPPQVVVSQRNALEASRRAATDTRASWFETVILDPVFHTLHTHIQESTDSVLALPAHQSKAIEAAMATGGPLRIPVEVRSALLSDVKTLRALHLESQLI